MERSATFKGILVFLPVMAVFLSTVLLDPTGLTPVQLMSLGQARALATLIVTFPFFLFYHRGILIEVNQLLRSMSQTPVSPAAYYFWVALGFFIVGIVTLESVGLAFEALPALWPVVFSGAFPTVLASSFSSLVTGGLLTHGIFNRFSPYPAMARRSKITGKKEPTLVYTDPAQKFIGIDLEHFVHAQNILTTRTLTQKAETDLRGLLGITGDIQGITFYERIYNELFQAENAKPLIDAIIQNSYADPRLAIEIVGQNPNPRGQSVFEAVANGLDALGFTIGQFGKGVKQIVDWLEPTGEDWLDVWTVKDGVHGHLRILRGTDGRYYIQIQPLSQEDFFQQTGTSLTHGTVLKVTTKNQIPSTEKEMGGVRRNSQDALLEGIHRRYAYVPEIQITTQKEGFPSTAVNGYAEKELIVPHNGRLPSADGRKKIHVAFSDHSIRVTDNGVGMSPETLFRMFVPKQGSKHPDPVGRESLPSELKKIRVVHINNPKFKNQVSFSRNGEVVTAVDIPSGLNPDSVVPGGLMLEMGSLVEVPESRDRVILSPSLREGEKTPFQNGVEWAVQGILDNPRLSALEKLRYVNTLIVGLDGLIQGNSHNAQVISPVRSRVRKLISPLIHRLQDSNIVVLPHDQAYRQVAVPPGKKALYLHEQLFDWQGWVSLKVVGARIVPQFPLGQHKEMVLVVVPFKAESVAQVKTFDPLWHTRPDNERFPIIKTDTFVAIPRELGDRLMTLATRRAEEPLPKTEEDEFVSLAQLINIYTAEEVVTDYELAPKTNVALFKPLEFKKSQGEIDSDAVNSFLTAPPPFETEGAATASIPKDSGQRLALMDNGDVVQIGTGRRIYKNVGKMEPIGNGYYIIHQLINEGRFLGLGDVWLPQVSLVHFNGIDLEPILSPGPHAGGRFVVFPNREFVYWDLETEDHPIVWGQSLFSIKEGKFLRLSKDGLTPSGPPSSVPPEPTMTERCYRFQTSRDGKYFSYVARTMPFGDEKGGGNETLVVVRTSDLTVLQRIPLNGGMFVDVVFDSRSPLLFVEFIDSPGQSPRFDIYDFETDQRWENLKTAYTNSTGDLTAMIHDDGMLSFYLHKARRTVEVGSGGDFGLTVFHADGNVYLHYGNDYFELLDSGEMAPRPNLPSRGWFEEVRGTLLLELGTKTEEGFGGVFGLCLNISKNPIERKSHGDVVHPQFPLFRGSSGVAYEDIASGEVFPSQNRIVGFDPVRKQIEVIDQGGFLNVVESESKGNSAVTLGRVMAADTFNGSQPRFLILVNDETGSDAYIFHDLRPKKVSNTLNNLMKVISKKRELEIQIHSKKYSQVNFDGIYFVFSDPHTGDVVYLNPESPQSPVFVSANPGAKVLNEKPEDAPSRKTLVPAAPNRQARLFGPLYSGKKRFYSARRVSEKLFVGNIENGVEVFSDGGAVLFTTAGTNWASKGLNFECRENSGRFVVLSFSGLGKNGLHLNAKLMVDEKGRYFPDINFSDNSIDQGLDGPAEIRISNSERYSVHVWADGTIVYYDHSLEDPVPMTIANGSEYADQRFYANAEIVVLEYDNFPKKPARTYSIYGLGGGFLVTHAEHITIDPSGEFAFIQNSDKTSSSYVIHLRSGRKFAVDMGGRGSFAVSRWGDHFMVLSVPQSIIKDHGRDPGLFLTSSELAGANYWEINGKGDILEQGIGINTSASPRIWFASNADGYIGTMDLGDRVNPDHPLGFFLASSYGPTRGITNFPEAHGPWLFEVSNMILQVDRLVDQTIPSGYKIEPVGTLYNHGIVALNSLVGEKVWYATNQTGEHFYLVGAPGVSFSQGTTIGEKTWVNQVKTHMLVERTESGHVVWYLIDGKGTVSPLKEIIPNGFVPVDVNGRYFVFHNYETEEFVFLAPTSAVDSPQGSPVEDNNSSFRALWDSKIIQRRGHFVQQIRQGFGPVLLLVPPAFLDFITRELQRIVSEYYGLQEKELRGRFKDAMSGAPFEEERLPFDLIESRLASAVVEVERVFEMFRDQVASAPFRVQKDFYANLFNGLLATVAMPDVTTDPAKPFLDAASLKAIALGWRVSSPSTWDALPMVRRLIDELQGAVHGGVSMESLQQMMGFLSGLAARAPPNEALVFSHQLEKLLSATPAAKQAYLQRFYSAFHNTPQTQWQGYLHGSNDTSVLGDLRPWVEFLTHEIDPVREKPRWIPEGEDIPMPVQGVEISQIIGEESQRPKKNTDDLVMSMDHLIDHIWNLPESNGSLEQEILRNITVQGESGAYTREIAQNSIDATQGRRGTLEVDYYLQESPDGREEFVEEARDNGTGALDEVALLIPRSTKATGAQSNFVGFFGTGKYTLLEDVDRLEIITKNRDHAFMFTLSVKKGENGRPTGVALTRIRRLNDKSLPEGVTVRRIKAIQNTIPGLDQRLAQLAWKTFAGLSQSDQFKIEFIDSDGKRRPLEVDAEVMTEADFVAVRRGEASPSSFGPFRIYRSKGLPSQVVDRKGLRIGEIKDEYLALIPENLKKHVKELGLILQIPLPLIRSRTGFEHENDYLSTIQKYVALEFYKTMARLALTEVRPAFVFEGLASDWEKNAKYWGLFGQSEKSIIDMSEAANAGRYDQISPDSLAELIPREQSRTNPDRRYMKLLVLLMVPQNLADPDSRTSLFLRRLAVLQAIDQQRAAAEMRRLQTLGLSVGRIPKPREIPGWAGYLDGAQTMHKVRKQSVEDFIIHPEKFSPEERQLVARGERVAALFGLEKVYLVARGYQASGAFGVIKDPATQGYHPSMVLNQGLAHSRGAYGEAVIDPVTNTIDHELGHLLEHLMESANIGIALKDGYRTHPIEQTHEQIGPFAEAMKYVSALWLVNGTAISPSISSEPKDKPMASPTKRSPSSPNSLAYLLTGNPWLGMAWVLLVEMPLLLTGNMPVLLLAFALVHVAIEFRNDPQLTPSQLVKSFLKHFLMASPYLLVAGVPGFDWATLFAVATHIVYDSLIIYKDRRDARRYAALAAKSVVEGGTSITTEDLVPFEGSLDVESLEGRVYAIHHLLGPKLRQPGFRLAFEKALKKSLNVSKGQVPPGFDLALRGLLGLSTGMKSDDNSSSVLWLVVDKDDIPSLNNIVGILDQRHKSGDKKTRLIISPARESLGDQLKTLHGAMPFANVLPDPITDSQMNLVPDLAKAAYTKWRKENPSSDGTPFVLSMVVSNSVYVDAKTVLAAASRADFEIPLKDALRTLLNQRIQFIEFESLIRLAQIVAKFA